MTDLASSFGKKVTANQQNLDIQELDQLFGAESGQPIPGAEGVRSGATIATDILNAPPRRKAGDTLGRPRPAEESTTGKVLHNVGEIVPGAARGVLKAVDEAFSFLDPVTDWLDQHVADLSFNVKEMDTPTGQISESIAQFMTGFVPAVKGLKAVGMTNKVLTPMVAGAVSDFATRDGHDAKLADLFVELGGERNVITEFLKADPNKSEIRGRFDAALEGLALGGATEGIIRTAAYGIQGAKNAFRSMPEEVTTELQVLKDKYGELTDEDLHHYLGDPTRPMVETHIKAPPAIAGKMTKAQNLSDLSPITPRALVRSAPQKAPQAPFLPEFENIFSKKALQGARKESEAGQLIMMSPDDFNKLAFPREQTYKDLTPEQIAALKEEKTAPLQQSVFKGKGITDIPELQIKDGKVVGHDGRHRMDLMKEMGMEKVPVRIKGQVPKAGNEIISETGEFSVVAPELHLPPVKVAGRADAGISSENFDTYINFARIDEPQQVQFAMGKMAEAFKGQVDEARRGVITHEQTQKMADDLGMTVADLLERRKGQPLNAEEALAARQLWAASGSQLVDAAKRAAGPGASAIDHFAFRRAMALHSAIQNEVIGARTETARALAQWRIPAGGSVERARAIEQVMKAAGGPEASTDMARRLAILAEAGASPAAIAKFARAGWGGVVNDAVKSIWLNGLLSSPKTHLVNTLSNTVVVAQQIYERGAAEAIAKLTGSGGVQPGETAAMVAGLFQSYRDAFRMAAKALKTGETGYAFNKIDVSHERAISAEAFRMSKETGTGRFVDFLGHAVDIPGRLLGAEDEFFKTIGYRMEVNAQAVRTARQEGLTGKAYLERVQDLMNNPSESIRLNAADAAMYNTFTNDLGKWGTAMMNLRNNIEPSYLVLPFVRTPANIARYSFERTPFAPFVRQWREDIAAGGARADIALARMATGTAIMATAMDFAQSGLISGNGPMGAGDKDTRESLLRSGWQPFSFKVGDRWYSYNRLDPFGMTLGFAATITEAVRKGELDEDDVDEWQEVMAMSIAAVSQTVVNKTYLQGMSNFVEMMSDPSRYSEGYVNNLVSSFVPLTALSGAVKQVDDPIQREANDPWEAMQAKIVGLSKNLSPKRDLWGRPISVSSGLGSVYDALTPIASKEEDVQPIDKEITRLGDGPMRIKKKTMFDGIQINFKKFPEAYDEYVRLSGNDLKHIAFGKGAMDYLNDVVTGKSPVSPAYQIMSDEGRVDFIKNAVSDFRKQAAYQIMNDPKFADFAQEVQRLKALQAQRKMPVLTGE